MRDDFNKSLKDTLAKRVAYRCSNPKCRKPTSAPHTIPDKAVSVGVAAHITAASPGGPRYDPLLSTQQRTSPANGIWLCQTCAKLIDSDAERFTKAVLVDWKETAEHFASTEIHQPANSNRINEPQRTQGLQTVTKLLSRGERRGAFMEHVQRLIEDLKDFPPDADASDLRTELAAKLHTLNDDFGDVIVDAHQFCLHQACDLAVKWKAAPVDTGRNSRATYIALRQIVKHLEEIR
jgi:hypothetical protein